MQKIKNKKEKKELLFKRLFINSFIYTGSSALPSIFGVFILPILSRFLNPDEFGILAIISLITGLISIFINATGIQAAVTRYYLEYKDRDLQEFIGTTYIFITILSICSVVLSFVIIYPLTNILFKTKVSLYPNWTIAFLSTFFGGYLLFPMAILRIREKPEKILLLNLIVIVSNYLVAIPLLFKKLKITAVLLGGLSSNLVIFLIATYYVFKKIKAKWTLNQGYLKEINSFSLPMLPYSIFSYVTSFSDRYFIERFFSVADLGLYSIANKLSFGVKMFVGSFGYTWGPYFFNEVKIDREGFKILFPKLARVWIFLIILLILFCSVFSKEMILLLTTKQFLKTYKIIPIFYIEYFFAFIYNFPNVVLLFEKKD